MPPKYVARFTPESSAITHVWLVPEDRLYAQVIRRHRANRLRLVQDEHPVARREFAATGRTAHRQWSFVEQVRKWKREKMTDENDEVTDEESGRSMKWMSDGIAISHRIMVVALAMILPVLCGWWLDQTLLAGISSRPIWGILTGVALGMLAAAWQLRSLLRWLDSRRQVSSPSELAEETEVRRPPKSLGG
jgi:hypothetical protein